MSPTSTPPTPEHDLLPGLPPETEPGAEWETGSAPPPPLLPTDPNAPLTFVPHTPEGAVSGQRVRIHTGRYGVLEEHELVRLLDSIEDERARGRFRESIYVSIFVWLAIAWVVLYGPRYLWHAPRIKLASDVLRERELATISLPPAPHIAPPAPPRVDNRTLERLRTETREAARRAPAPAPAPAASLPNAPTPAPNIAQPPPPVVQPARTPPPVVAEAPLPQAPSRPNFNTGSETPGQQMRQALGNAPSVSRLPPSRPVPIRGGGERGSGMSIVSDTQGVDFRRWMLRVHDDIERTWTPLLPEEIYPPLSRTGQTVIRVTILPDGTIGDMKMMGSTHEVAIDHSAWGAIVSENRFPSLPAEFHGPNIVVDMQFSVEHEPSSGP